MTQYDAKKEAEDLALYWECRSDWIEQALLSAYRAGLMRAAEIIKEYKDSYYVEWSREAVERVIKAEAERSGE